MSALTVLLMSITAGFLGLGTAIVRSLQICRTPAGSEYIHKGEMAFPVKEYRVAATFIAATFFLLTLFMDRGFPLTALCFLGGALTSIMSSFLGICTAMRAHVRATLGLGVVGIGVLGIALGFLALSSLAGLDTIPALRALTGFAFGASSIALFARIGGGIFAKAANVRSDPAGMGADLYESYVGSIIAAMLIGAETIGTESAVLFPLAFSGLGVLASIACSFFVGRSGPSSSVGKVPRCSTISATVIMLFVAPFAARWFFGTPMSTGIAMALVAGLVMGVAWRFLTEYYTSADFGPVEHVAEATGTGAATNITSGLALGYLSTALPVFCIVLAIGVAHIAAGLYGIALAAVGMLSTLGMMLTADAHGPIADKAGGTAAMSDKGFAIGAAALTALAFFTAFSQAAKLSVIDLTQPIVLIGLLIGGMLPFLFSSLTMSAIGRATHAMITPGLLAVLTPIIIGLVLGAEALAGLLAGSLVSGVLIAIAMTNSGGAWDSAQRSIEGGKFGGRGSEAEKSAGVGVGVGSPLQDTAGPAINILIKVMPIVALLTAGLYTATGVL